MCQSALNISCLKFPDITQASFSNNASHQACCFADSGRIFTSNYALLPLDLREAAQIVQQLTDLGVDAGI